MEHFNRFYSPEVIARIVASTADANSGVAYFLSDPGEAARMRREEFDRYREEAYRHSVLDVDMSRRLQSSDWEQFVQARNELLAAWFCESLLKRNIRFRPKGRDGSIGEFKIVDPTSGDTFVEVKSPWKEPPQNRVWSGHDGKKIRQNVVRARRQLPEDGANLVIVSGYLPAGLSDPLSGMIQALYGEPVLRIPIGVAREPRETVNPNGLFQPNSNRRISAVATLEEVVGSPYLDSVLRHLLSGEATEIDESAPMNVLKYAFRVYHNPYARHPIDPAFFGTYPQFLPTREGDGMAWELRS